MTKAHDFTKAIQDMMSAFPVDMATCQAAFTKQAKLVEEMSRITLSAAEQSADISTKWTRNAISQLTNATTAKSDAAEYVKAGSDYVSASAETAAEHVAAFTEVAKKVQMETVELMLAAGKNLSAEATSAVKRASMTVVDAGKKAASAAAK